MKMPKRDYFLMCLEAGCYRYKQWVLELFTVTRKSDSPIARPYPYALNREDGGRIWFLNDDGVEVDVLGGYKDGPLASVYDELVLTVGDLPNLNDAVISTFGQAFINQLALVHPFGAKIPYMNGEIKVSDIEQIVEKRLVDNKNADADPTAISIAELLRFNEACTMSAEYANMVVPAASVKTMTVNPAIRVRRAELLEKYKDRLADPVVQTLIANELIQMDRDWMVGDVGEGFYFKAKSYNVVRKKLFLTVGVEQGFDVAGDMIAESLEEGWQVQSLPSIVNGLRDGSYNRGAMTALGGEATKFNYRIFQNTRIATDDCGTVHGLSMVITEKTKRYYLSNSIVVNKKAVELTADNLDQYVDKAVILRSPTYCLAEGANFCLTCMGKRMADSPEALSTYAADIGSTFMSINMGAMHGKTLSVARWDPFSQLR